MFRHTDKFCFAPESVSLTALGRDEDWKTAWVSYAERKADLVVGITTRLDSPISRALEACRRTKILVCPRRHAEITTLVIPARTFHEFEVNALWTIYQIIEELGVSLPSIE